MKKQLSAVLAVTMAFGMSATAFADTTVNKGDISMDNNVASPILSYVVPTVVSYSIDAFGKLDASSGSQIYSGDLEFINKSDVNVSIKVKAKATPKTGVTVVPTPDKVNTDDFTNTAKELYLEAVVADTVAAAGSGVTGATVDGVNSSMDILEGKENAKAVTLTTAGNPDSAAAVITIDLEGVGAKVVGEDPTLATNVVELVLKDGDTVLGKIVSNTAIDPVDDVAGIATDEEIAASFASAAVTINGVDYTVGYDSSGAPKKITITADANGGLATLAAGKATLQKPTGTPGVTAVAVTNVTQFGPTSVKPDVVGADTDSKVPLASGANRSLLFALQASDYKKPTVDQDATVFDKITANSATSIRLMGKVNPVAAWADQDVKVTFSYDINPMSPTMYTTATDKTSAAGYKAGLFEIPATTGTVAGTVAAADAKADGVLATYWVDGKLTIPVTEVAKDGTDLAVTIKTIQYRPDTTVSTGAFLTSNDKAITDGKITIAPIASNATKIDNGGVVVVITFTDNNKVTLTLPKA